MSNLSNLGLGSLTLPYKILYIASDSPSAVLLPPKSPNIVLHLQSTIFRFLLVYTDHRASRSMPDQSPVMVFPRIEALLGRIRDRSSCPFHCIEKRLCT